MTGRAAPCKNSNAIPILENRVGCYESAKAKFKNPRCGQACHAACHAKAQTDQGVSNSFRIVWPTTISQENTTPRRCTQKQESMLGTDHCTRFRRHNQLRKTSLNLRTSSSTPPCPSGISETYVSKLVCGSIAWRKFRPFLLVCMREQKLNIMSQHK